MSSFTLSLLAAVLLDLRLFDGGLPAYGQTTPDLKKVNPQFVGEPGCPVEVVGATSAFEIDSFGTPMAARHYIDYRNSGNRPIAAVKFRIAYVSADGKIRQSYLNAADAHSLDPGGQASQKWRGDKVDPKTAAVKLRVLLVKFADGSVWESEKINQTNAQQQEGFLPLQTESPGTDLAENFIPGSPVPFKSYQNSQSSGFPSQTQTGPVQFKSTGGGSPGFAPGAFGSAVPLTTVPSGAASVSNPGGVNGAAVPLPVTPAPAAAAPANFAPPVTSAPVAAPVVTAPVDPVSQLDDMLGNRQKAVPVAIPTPAPIIPAAPASVVAAPAADVAPASTVPSDSAGSPSGVATPAVPSTPSASVSPTSPVIAPEPASAAPSPSVPSSVPEAPLKSESAPAGTAAAAAVPVNPADKGNAELDEFLK